MMILIAVVAVVTHCYLMKRRWDAAVLEHARASDRLEWSEKMHQKGYVSKAQFLSDKLQFEKIKQRLGY